MADKSKTQKVVLFPEDAEHKREAEQTVHYTEEDNWVNIIHAGEELSMSLDNWNALLKLAKETIPN